MRKVADRLIFSPTDLVRYVASPFASWMDRYLLENPQVVEPDEESEDQKLIARTGDEHELSVLVDFKAAGIAVTEIAKSDADKALADTVAAIKAKAPVIYQAALVDDRFAGFADFLIVDEQGRYQVWDTKLARAPKPYYAIQLCCYLEMLVATAGGATPERFGIILGTKDRVEFRVEDFVHYYRGLRRRFLAMQDGFTGNLADRPEPLPRADHGRWASYAEEFFEESDHLVQVAGITVGQIKKLKAANILTMEHLAGAAGMQVLRLAADSLAKLSAQARLQCRTREDRRADPNASAHVEVLAHVGRNEEPIGLAMLPPADPADVFFDMEGYPLAPGGLEYLFGAVTIDGQSGAPAFRDWWAHSREEEKNAFEGFIDWAHARWREHPGMHIYHYAAYEVNAASRLSTRHDTRQDEVDDLLRANVFVDLYRIVRQGLRIGEGSYSIKAIEHLYNAKRHGEVANAAQSMVQYSSWMGSKQSPQWQESPILKSIRDYNQEDCASNAALAEWLRGIAKEHHIAYHPNGADDDLESEPKEAKAEVVERHEVIGKLREREDPISQAIANLIDFHRREQKPMWWRMFDRAEATAEELRDDSGCVEGLSADGPAMAEKRSFIQEYRFDPAQECKLAAGERSRVMFTHDTKAKFTLVDIDLDEGTLRLKIGKKTLDERFGGMFPEEGSVIPDEYIGAEVIQAALTAIGSAHLEDSLPDPVVALLTRAAPAAELQANGESTIEAAIRVAREMAGGCLVIQGPPGTGKTYTAAQVIHSLLAAGMKVGITSNSHKAIVNLLLACGDVASANAGQLAGIKVGGDSDGDLFNKNAAMRHVESSKGARAAYSDGVIGGTAWLFTLPEWQGTLDYLFIDEAGQVSLANTLAMARAAKNVILLGDQMQLEQPIQGTHPGDAGLSSLQYALKDLAASKTDAPIFFAVVPQNYGLFLGESRRMHPSVCRFVSEIVYENRLSSHADCHQQRIVVPDNRPNLVGVESGVFFIGVEHDGNIQQSEEEVECVRRIFDELLGRPYTASNGTTRPLVLSDFLFISPYNAQVRALEAVLPAEARVGSVDRFQGQEAAVCILSLCSSYGEYGSRGLAFILDRNRINVAISRAQCLAIVVSDPRIASASAASISEMKLLNIFCKLSNARFA